MARAELPQKTSTRSQRTICGWSAGAHCVAARQIVSALVPERPMERKGIEPSTSALRTRRSPN